MRSGTILVLVLTCISVAIAQDTQYPAQNGMIPGPPTPAAFQSWLNDLKHWRLETLIRLGYYGSEYDRPEFEVDAELLHSAPDDDPRPVFLRPHFAEIYGGPVPG